jgi:CRISPR/Cas system-associated exonuclease Cas4 (RecB family)
MQWDSKYTRVTEVLAPFSGMDKIPAQILQRAAERGTKVHEICDAIISGMGCPEIPENLQGYIRSFQQWGYRDFIVKPNRFYCDDLHITGECDAIYQDGKGLVLVDFKTSVKESKTWVLQGAAYAYLARKSGYDIQRVEFIRLVKDGIYPQRRFRNI